MAKRRRCRWKANDNGASSVVGVRMINSAIDHVAIAVPNRSPAIDRYVNQFGGGSVASGRRAGITIDQIIFAHRTKLEIVSPDPDSPKRERLNDFLKKHGPVIHHVTVRVESVRDSVNKLKHSGVQLVGLRLDDPRYQEAFVLPNQGGGVMVQLTWKDVDDEGWARRHGHCRTEPRPECPDFIGVRWSQPNLEAIADQWRILGGTPKMRDGVLTVSWGPGQIQFEYVVGESRATEELLFEGTPCLPASSDLGPGIVSSVRLE